MTTSTKPVAIRDNDGLTDTQIERYCPSVFAENAHESRSSRYFYIPTKEILSALRAEGFFPTAVMQSGSRIEGKEAFTKHLVRFRRQNDLGDATLNQDVHEIVLINSHDGTSSYQLMSGIFRLVCTNGLVKGDINSRLRVYHKGGDELANIVNATYSIVEQGEELMNTVEEMKHISLSREEQLLLAKYAMYARFDLPADAPANVVDALPATTTPIVYQPSDFLRTRRMEDRGQDLYTTVNKVQENVIKGGVRRYDAKRQKHTVREVKGIDQSVKVNSLIWSFAEELRKIHQN